MADKFVADKHEYLKNAQLGIGGQDWGFSGWHGLPPSQPLGGLSYTTTGTAQPAVYTSAAQIIGTSGQSS